MSLQQDSLFFHDPVPQPVTRFGSVELSRRLDITPRQLQWWDEQRLLPAHHEGHKRFYTSHDALLAGVIAKLREAGLGSKRLKQALRPIMHARRDESLARYLVVNWRSGWSAVAARENQALGIVSTLSHQGMPSLLIDLEQIERRLR